MIRSLTSLRFIFALMIFMHHFSMGEQVIFPEGGVVAVCFFFVLSGFVLAYSYEGRLMEGKTDKKVFYVGRLSKLYPLHILCSFAALFLTFKLLTWKYWLVVPVNLALLQSWIPIKEVYFSCNAVSWFSSAMLFFYIIFPWLAGKISVLKWRVLGIYGAAILTVYFILIKFVPESWQHALFYINPGLRLLDFTLGIVLYKAVRLLMQENNKEYSKWLVTLFEVLVVILFAFFIFSAGAFPQVYRYAVYYWIPVVLILFVFTYFNEQGGDLTRILSNRWLVCLGEVSFSFYMIHQLVIRFYGMLIRWVDVTLFWWNGFIIVLAVTIGVSFISFYYIEKPLAKWLKSKFF